MYTLVQNENFLDDIQLKKVDGTTETLHISLSITPDTIKKYRQMQIRLMELEKKRKASPGDDETIAQIGQAVVDVFNLLFSTENARKLLEFYRQDFTQMMAEVFPYIQNVILPKFQQAAKSRKQTMKRKFR